MSKLVLEQNLPKNWIEVDLENILSKLDSGSRPKGGVGGIEQGIPSIGGEHLDYNGSFNLQNIRFVPEKFYDEMTKGHIQINDVLMVKDGATTGKTSFVNQSFPFKKSAVNEHVFILRGIDSIIFQPYLFRYLFSSIGQRVIKGRITGSAQGGINTSFVKNFPIPIPPLNEQKRIVAKIEELFSLIDASEKSCIFLIQRINEYWKMILDLALRGILTSNWREIKKIQKPNDHEIENWKKMRENQYHYGCKLSRNKTKPKLTSFTTCELSNFPDSWIGMPIESACGHIIDCPHSTPKFLDHGKYCIDTTCIENSKIRLEDLRFVSKTEFEDRSIRMPVLENDVLFSREGTIGTTVLVPPNLDLCLGQRIMILRFAPFVLPKFAELFLQSFEFQKQYKPLIKSTTSPHLNIEDIRKFFITVPSMQEQEIILKILDEKISLIISIKNTIQKSLLQLKILRSSILYLGFEGKLVPQDPNDEPAQILLEKIKQEKQKIISQTKRGKRNDK